MKVTREQQKAKALELLGKLGAHELYIKCVAESDDFVGNFFSWHTASGIVKTMVERLEREKGIFVYYVTKEIMPFGECFSFLCVSSYEEDLPRQDIRDCKNGEKLVFAWVENLDKPQYSEYGTIAVRNDNGFLFRVA